MKHLIILLLPLFLAMMSCTMHVTIHDQQPAANNDTSYFTSTKKLRSNKIPDSVFDMPHLKHLAIIGDDCDYGRIYKNGIDVTECWMIDSVSPLIQNLPELESIQLNVNALGSIPVEWTALPNLRSIDLTDNVSLTNIDQVVKMKTLESLSVYGCSITKLPLEIGVLKKLKHLGLTGNPLAAGELARVRLALPACDVTF